MPTTITEDLAPTGVLRVSINLGNPVLAQGTPTAPTFRTATDVDRPGVRIGVKQGSAYDLYLSRTLRHAEVVRGTDGIDEFRAQGLDAAAGIRQPMTEFVATQPNVRLIDDRFMEIQQAVGTTRTRQPATVGFLRDLVTELKGNGFVADALRRANQFDVTVAP
ncbi:MAG TPA: hypothetical protein VF892_09115 [Pseudonocardiaceae bacterium]|nr:hypothetical protein [Pseudonocardiaceae bacterium]